MGAVQTFQVNLAFVGPCIIIHSNKSTNQMHQALRFLARSLNTAQTAGPTTTNDSATTFQR